jgi:hypothetical protein
MQSYTPPIQVLPPWLTYSSFTVTYPTGGSSIITTVLNLPLTYYGPYVSYSRFEIKSLPDVLHLADPPSDRWLMGMGRANISRTLFNDTDSHIVDVDYLRNLHTYSLPAVLDGVCLEYFFEHIFILITPLNVLRVCFDSSFPTLRNPLINEIGSLPRFRCFYILSRSVLLSSSRSSTVPPGTGPQSHHRH